MASSSLIYETGAWKDLKVNSKFHLLGFFDLFRCACWRSILVHFHQAHVEDIEKIHLRDLMSDTVRCKSMIMYDIPKFEFKIGLYAVTCVYLFLITISYSDFDGVLLDYSRQRANFDTLNKLHNLAKVS